MLNSSYFILLDEFLVCWQRGSQEKLVGLCQRYEEFWSDPRRLGMLGEKMIGK